MMRFCSDSTGYLRVTFEHAIPQDILEFPLSTKGCRICGRLVFASSLMRTVFTLQSFCYFQAFGYSNVFSVQRSEISIAASAFFHCYIIAVLFQRAPQDSQDSRLWRERLCLSTSSTAHIIYVTHHTSHSTHHTSHNPLSPSVPRH